MAKKIKITDLEITAVVLMSNSQKTGNHHQEQNLLDGGNIISFCPRVLQSPCRGE